MSRQSYTPYETDNGWFVQGYRFADKEAAERWAKREMARPRFDFEGAEQYLVDQDIGDAARNKERFLAMRAEGRAYYTTDGTTRFWLHEGGLAERRAEGLVLVPATIDYEEGDSYECGAPWKQASVVDIEAMLAAGKAIVLLNC